jgi:hypothetical protein
VKGKKYSVVRFIRQLRIFRAPCDKVLAGVRKAAQLKQGRKGGWRHCPGQVAGSPSPLWVLGVRLSSVCISAYWRQGARPTSRVLSFQVQRPGDRTNSPVRQAGFAFRASGQQADRPGEDSWGLRGSIRATSQPLRQGSI